MKEKESKYLGKFVAGDVIALDYRLDGTIGVDDFKRRQRKGRTRGMVE